MFLTPVNERFKREREMGLPTPKLKPVLILVLAIPSSTIEVHIPGAQYKRDDDAEIFTV